MRQNADKLRINPDRIALGGDSAGGGSIQYGDYILRKRQRAL